MNYKTEKEKYIDLYSGELHNIYVKNDSRGQVDGGYGRANWGENAVPFLNSKGAKCVIDYGCGYGRFCDLATQSIEKVYGLDIASVATGNVIDNDKINFIDGDGTTIPLEDNSIEWVTSFDCLEHIGEGDLNTVLGEFDRVSTKGFIVSVAFIPDNLAGVPLHLTIKPKEWWLSKLSNYGKVYEHGSVPLTGLPYIVVEKNV